VERVSATLVVDVEDILFQFFAVKENLPPAAVTGLNSVVFPLLKWYKRPVVVRRGTVV